MVVAKELPEGSSLILDIPIAKQRQQLWFTPVYRIFVYRSSLGAFRLTSGRGDKNLPYFYPVRQLGLTKNFLYEI